MRIAISGIAWDISEDEDVARLLHQFEVDAIDVVPGKYFSEPGRVSGDEQLSAVRGWWAERGIEIVGMQALLFGTTGLNMFGPAEMRESMLQYLSAVIGSGKPLGATRAVFGSPRNRDRSGLSDDQVMEIAVPFFKRLGDVAESCGVMLCLEPTPACYGANFMTTSQETAQVVREVAHPSVRMQLDTGALAINGEDPEVVLQELASLVGHIHASEPKLVPLGEGTTDHARVGRAVAARLPNQVVTVEMLPTSSEPHLQSIERALRVAVSYYRRTEGRGNP
jgi:D-psicose/D-tagatose/L-ribulose 3-epimerase